MPCYHPLQGYKSALTTKNGKRKLTFSVSQGYADLPITVACGQCIGCRLERSRQWAVRLMHEKQMHELSCFVTLTYSPEKLPAGGSLQKRDFQLFMKRLRKVHAPKNLRFFHCGEYGDELSRPHYHALLYGIDFADKKPHSKNAQGETLYKSETLETLWGHGFCLLGQVTHQSAAYVARYVMKKQTGPKALEHYTRLDLETGEVYQLQPEYVTMSLKPGIGASWYETFGSDIFPRDRAIVAGKETTPPRYYLRRYAAQSESAAKKITYKRIRSASKHKADQTPERLAVREICRKAKISQLKRSIHS